MPPRTLDAYLTLPWTIRVQRRTDDGVYWAAEVEELPGLVAAGATWAELGEMLQDALASYLSAMLESGEEIPLAHSVAARPAGERAAGGVSHSA